MTRVNESDVMLISGLFSIKPCLCNLRNISRSGTRIAHRCLRVNPNELMG